MNRGAQKPQRGLDCSTIVFKQPSQRARAPHLLALLGYSLLALLFVWPLPIRLTDRITGDPAGDAGAYVWNAYVFSRNVAAGQSVLHTDRILALVSEASLALHNNSLLLSAFAAPLIPMFGVIASFNLALIGILILNPFCAYLLAWHETRSRAAAWLGGALFGFSPFISARVEGHMSLATAFGLPLVMLFVRRALVSGAPLDWGLVGVSLAVCAASDPYYLIFGVIAVGLAWLFERVTIVAVPRRKSPILARLAFALAVPGAVALLWIGLAGGGDVFLGPFRLGVRSPHTPVLVLSISAALFLAARHPRRVHMEVAALRSLKLPALAGLVATTLLFPWLSVAASEVLAKGGMATTAWRSSPAGVDLLSFFMPNPTHPLFREIVEPWMTRQRADAFIEGVASFTVAAILIVALLTAYRQAIMPRFWLVFTAFFTALALGPFVLIGGEPTYVPGPWAVLRFLPGIGMVRSPSRFAALATLGIALLLAHAVATARLGRARAAAIATIALLLGLETIAPPRRLFPALLPERYKVVADDRCDVAVLRLPTGIKDGTRQRGHFSSETQFRQVFHGKRLLGGYLSRLSDDTVEAYEGNPTIRALLDLSEGKTISAEARKEAVAGAAALSRLVGVGFIAVNKEEASQDLRDFVQEAFLPRVIHKAWPFAIYIPFGDRCAQGECGHRPGCPHREFRESPAPGAAGGQEQTAPGLTKTGT